MTKKINAFHHMFPLEMTAGVYKYNFSHLLPEDLPYTFSIDHFGKKNSIEYFVKTTLIASGETVKENFEIFSVSNQLDLNTLPSLRLGQRGEEILDRCPSLCEKGKILITATIPASGYAVGEKIPINICYINNSNVDVFGTCVWLIQQVELRIDDSLTPCTVIENTVLEKKFDNYKLRADIDEKYFFELPSNMYISNDHICKLIKVKYCLKIQPITSSYGYDTTLIFPITIGSVGIQNTNQQGSTVFREIAAPSAPNIESFLESNDGIEMCQRNIIRPDMEHQLILPSKYTILDVLRKLIP